MIEFAKREKMNSPINFEWCDDFMNPKTKLDVLDPFIESNEGSIASDDHSEFSCMPKSDLRSDTNAVSESISMDSRKRRSTSISPTSEITGPITRRKKKPKGMPKRPLSAYNLFFQSEKSKIQAAAEGSGERIGFEGLGKIIGKKWKELSNAERKMYEKLAEKDTTRYRKEMEAYNELRTKRTEDEERIASSTPIIQAASDQRPDDAHVRAYQNEEYLRRSALNQQPETFMAAPSTQPMSISSREEFSRIHSLTTPHPSSHFIPTSQCQMPDRASLESNIPSGLYQSRYEDSYQGGPGPLCAPQVSLPPPPLNAEPVAPPSSFHMPPGMEIVLSDRTGQDRKYCVQYTCYSMTRDAARKYIGSWTSTANRGRRSPPPTQQMQPMQMNFGMNNGQHR